MLKPITTNQFEKDIKLIKKRGKELNKIFKIMQLLLNQEKLPPKNRDHALTGNAMVTNLHIALNLAA